MKIGFEISVKRILIVIILQLFLIELYSASELDLFEEYPVVYTPAKKEQMIRESPASTYVISSEDIRNYAGENIYDSLRLVSGVNVISATRAQPDISIRGLNENVANSTLVLLDGRNVYLPLQGVFFWETLPVQLEEIKQIEIVKGPVASLYGANTLNGVINIITKKPEDIHDSLISTELGTKGTYEVSLLMGEKKDQFGYKVSLGWEAFDFSDEEEFQTKVGKLNMQFDYDFDDEVKLSLSAGGTSGQFAFKSDIYNEFLGLYDGEFSYLKLDYQHHQFIGKLFWNHTQATYDPSAFFIDANINSFEGEIKYLFNLFDHHEIIFGGGARYDVTKDNVLASSSLKHDLNFLNIYIQDDIKISDHFSLILSSRIDESSEADPYLSNHLAGVIHLNDLNYLRLSIGNSFRAPTQTEYFMDVRFTRNMIQTHFRGNPNVDLEKIITGEMSYEGLFFNQKLKMNVDLYMSQMKDIISPSFQGFESLVPLTVLTTFKNKGEIQTWGIEPSLEIKITDFSTCFLNYSYQDDKYKQSALVLYTPKHKINFGIKVKLYSKWMIGIYNHYVSESFTFDLSQGLNRVDEYNLLNCKMTYHPKEWMEMSLTGFNLIDDEHRQAVNGEPIQTKVTGTISFQW